MVSSFEHDKTFVLPTSLFEHGWDPVELVNGDGAGLSGRRSMTAASKTPER
jgi:hypothetical protein